MKRYISAVIMGIACFALGAAVQRYYDTRLTTPVETAKLPAENGTPSADSTGVADVSTINFDREPLWAYGFDRPPLPGEKASPQNPPSRNLRPDEDPNEQTRPRRLPGSNATYSLVDVRDGQNVIDWFPEAHPPMPNVVAHGPAALAEKRRGCGSCHLPTGTYATNPERGLRYISACSSFSGISMMRPAIGSVIACSIGRNRLPAIRVFGTRSVSTTRIHGVHFIELK